MGRGGVVEGRGGVAKADGRRHFEAVRTNGVFICAGWLCSHSIWVPRMLRLRSGTCVPPARQQLSEWAYYRRESLGPWTPHVTSMRNGELLNWLRPGSRPLTLMTAGRCGPAL